MAEMVDIVMPDSDQEGTESVLESWFKKVGEYIKKHEPILEVSTDKVSMEVSAPESGVLREILKEPNEPIEPGEILGRIEVSEAAPAESPGSAPADGEGRHERRRARREPGKEPRLSPAVRKRLEVHNIDPADINGSGRGGRITIEDVEGYLAKAEKPAPKTAGGDIPGRMVPHNALRRRTASHMVESMLKTAPHVTAVFEADFSAVIAHREANKKAFADKDIKLTFTPYIVVATVKALREVPEINSRWHADALEIYEDFNIGIAAATDEGLIVPVIHRAQTLDLDQIAARLQDLTGRAREGRLEKADVQKGTFTITNHGMTGSLIATPIIHQPQSAILGVGKLEKRVVVATDGGKDRTEIRPLAYVTLTIDHRALDGFTANRFLTAFVETLEGWGGEN